MATAESVKKKIQGLIDTANEATGNDDTDLTTAVGALVAGFGQGGGGDNPLDYAISIAKLFQLQNFSGIIEALSISFGSKSPANISSTAMEYVLNANKIPKNVKIHCGGTYSGGISFVGAFRSMVSNYSTLETLDLLGWENGLKPSSLDNTFRENISVKEILGDFDMTYCTTCSRGFENCKKLETIRFVAGTISVSIDFSYSSLLTDASIQSIIDGLADLTGGTAQTLTLHADVGAKLTDAQKSAASAKNWTISY